MEERLAAATEALSKVLEKIDAQYAALNAKVDRIVAAIDECLAKDSPGEEKRPADVSASAELKDKVARLEREKTEIQAQAQRAMRKTVSPMVSTLLAKSGVEGFAVEEGVLDRALAALSVEQRIAVKAEMARAGIIG